MLECLRFNSVNSKRLDLSVKPYDEDKTLVFPDVGEVKSATLYSSDDVVPHTVFEQRILPIELDGNKQKIVLPKLSIATVQIKVSEGVK